MIGQTFGRWVVVSQAESKKGRRFNCKCQCGSEKVVYAYSLKSGDSKSCGCWRDEKASVTSSTHGHSRVGQHSPEYVCWTLMKRRCLNKNSKDYPEYGGAGVKVCPEWIASFEKFLADMGPRPEGRTLDRKDGTKGYSAENCKWSTPAEQSLNRKSTVWIEYQGVKLSQSQWAAKLGISADTIRARMKKGLSLDKVLKA